MIIYLPLYPGIARIKEKDRGMDSSEYTKMIERDLIELFLRRTKERTMELVNGAFFGFLFKRHRLSVREKEHDYLYRSFFLQSYSKDPVSNSYDKLNRYIAQI